MLLRRMLQLRQQLTDICDVVLVKHVIRAFEACKRTHKSDGLHRTPWEQSDPALCGERRLCHAIQSRP